MDGVSGITGACSGLVQSKYELFWMEGVSGITGACSGSVQSKYDLFWVEGVSGITGACSGSMVVWAPSLAQDGCIIRASLCECLHEAHYSGTAHASSGETTTARLEIEAK